MFLQFLQPTLAFLLIGIALPNFTSKPKNHIKETRIIPDHVLEYRKDTSAFNSLKKDSLTIRKSTSVSSPFLKTSTGSTCLNENPLLVASGYPNELALEWIKDGAPLKHSGVTYNPLHEGTYSVIPYEVSPYEDWNWITEKIYTHDIQAVQMTTLNDIFMADKGGAMKISHDGGETWTVREFTLSFYDLFFINENIGFALGFRNGQNYILKTTDKGINWQEIPVGTVTFSLDDMHFINESIGFIIGSQETIYKTLDGGYTWILQRHKNYGDYIHLNSVHFSDETNGWISGQHGTLFRTVDGGENWFTSYQDFNTSINHVFFTSPETGYILRSNFKAYKTSNGGYSWDEIPDINASYFGKIAFISANEGYIAAIGKIYKTLDGGTNWTSIEHKTAVLGCSFINNTHGIIVGAKGKAQVTHDGAQTWPYEVNFDNPPNINSVSFKTDTGWAITPYQIGYTLDEGKHFVWSNFSDQLTSMDVTFQTKWISQNKALYKSNDNGENWQLVNNFVLPENGNIKKIHFLNENLGFFVGSRGILFKTIDSGQNWTKIELGNSYSPPSFSDIEFHNQSDGLLTTYEGTVYRTIDTGERWSTLNSLSEGGALKIHYLDQFKVWIVFDHSLIYSNDAGNTWVTRDTYIDIKHIEFIDEWNGYAKIYGYLYFTNNGGSSWTRQTLPIPDISTFELVEDKPLVAKGVNSILKYGPIITKYSESNHVVIQNTLKPTISSFSNIICPNQSLKLFSTACNGITRWSSAQEGPEITTLYAGSYTINCTENGCKSPESNPMVITEKASCPSISIKEKNIYVCPNEEFTLNVSGCPSEKYLWSNSMTGNSISLNINTDNFELTAFCEEGGSYSTIIKLAANDLNISEDIFDEFTQLKSLNHININSKVTLQTPNTEVLLHGGKSILLQPGFQSSITQGNFKAEILKCPY